MIAADTSVLVPALTTPHEHHERAVVALRRTGVLLAHAELETYAVLTRLPPPSRRPAPLVAELLAQRYPEDRLDLPPSARRMLLADLAAKGVVGGAVYDALIAATAAHHGATLLSLDGRAQATYARVGARYERV